MAFLFKSSALYKINDRVYDHGSCVHEAMGISQVNPMLNPTKRCLGKEPKCKLHSLFIKLPHIIGVVSTSGFICSRLGAAKAMFTKIN